MVTSALDTRHGVYLPAEAFEVIDPLLIGGYFGRGRGFLGLALRRRVAASGPGRTTMRIAATSPIRTRIPKRISFWMP